MTRRRRHGLTLLEMLLALALLSAIIAPTASWTQIAASTASADGPIARSRREGAMTAVLDQIQQDFACGDFVDPSDKAFGMDPKPRVTVSETELSIATRWAGIGKVLHAYKLDAPTGVFQLIERVGDKAITSLLVDHIKSVQFREDAELRELSVTITQANGAEFKRRYRLS